MQMESNSNLAMCLKVHKVIVLLCTFSAIASFPQLLKHNADMAVSYCIVPYLQRCYAGVVMSNVVHNY